MLVEVGRTADGLTRVVDDEVQPLLRCQHLLAKRFHARRVPQVESVDLEPVGPVAEVVLPRVAHGRIAGKACRDDEARAGAKQLDPGLVPDLHTPTSEQCDTSRQIREFCTLREILVRARHAQAVVEMVDRRESRLADVTDPRVLGLAEAVRRCREARSISADRCSAT